MEKLTQTTKKQHRITIPLILSKIKDFSQNCNEIAQKFKQAIEKRGEKEFTRDLEQAWYKIQLKRRFKPLSNTPNITTEVTCPICEDDLTYLDMNGKCHRCSYSNPSNVEFCEILSKQNYGGKNE